MDPDPVITCIDCGGRAHLMSKPDDYGWAPGQHLVYRCEDCLDRWELIHEDDDHEPDDRFE